MAKKFGKFLLLTAAVGSAAAAVYYYMQKKDSVIDIPEDEDYDDFSDDADTQSSESDGYVSLTPETAAENDPEISDNASTESAAGQTPQKEESSFVPLSEQTAQSAETAEETVEEFFDEDDNAEEEPSIKEEN